MDTKKVLKVGLGFFLVFLLAILYRNYNPLEHSFFPKCPFLVATGYQCPGCGSQRAVHHLLHLEIDQALGENMLLVIFIPYILTGFLIDLLKWPTERVLEFRRKFFGRKAILVVLSVIISFWILRNTTIWPSFL